MVEKLPAVMFMFFCIFTLFFFTTALKSNHNVKLPFEYPSTSPEIKPVNVL